MERMSKQQEKEMVGYVQNVIDHVSAGLNPTDALYKVAVDKSLPPQFIQRVGEAYNQSRTLYELHEKKGSDRLQTFSVANPDSVISKMYPPTYDNKVTENVKQAAYNSYRTPTRNYFEAKPEVKAPVMEKKASYKATPTHDQIAKAKLEKAAATIQLERVIDTLADNLRSASNTTPFHTIEIGLHQKYGSVVQPLIKLAFDAARLEKFGQRRALPHELDASNYTLADFKGFGYATMENLIGAAMNLHKRANEVKVVCDECDSGEQNKLKTPKSTEKPNVQVTAESGTEKKAFGEPAGAVTSWIQRQVKDRKVQAQETYKNELDRAIVALEDPKFKNEMAQVDIQAMLHDFMSNDEVISSYDPTEISDAFNQIYQVAPDAVKSKAAVRDLMRRYLVQGGLESMEIGQASQLNKNIFERNNLTNRKDWVGSMQADPRLRTTDKLTDDKKNNIPGGAINL